VAAGNLQSYQKTNNRLAGLLAHRVHRMKKIRPQNTFGTVSAAPPYHLQAGRRCRAALDWQENEGLGRKK
jgi:hypothetical protein